MELMVPLRSKSKVPLYEQIYRYVKDEIREGNLKAAAKLPSTRRLAENLKVSRSTVQMAYDQLLSEGYIESCACKGYFVSGIEELVEVEPKGAGEFVPSMPEKAGEYLVDFSPRGIDLDNFPFHTWRKLSRNILVDDNKELFVTGDPRGEPSLRTAIRDYLHSARGVNCAADQIVIGAGSEYLLMLLRQILGESHAIAMENPTYRQAYLVLDSLGYDVLPVEMDKQGMDVGKLETSFADVAYVMPSHQYPVGIVMPVKRRQELLNWAYRQGGRYLIEDDYDSEFRYKGKPVPALQGMDTRERVIYMGTFSKSIAPAIRVSYMVLPKHLMRVYWEKAGFYAPTVSRIDQNILYRFIVDGYYERHLNRMRALYKSKHDVLLTELKPLESSFYVGGEYAGLHVLLTSRRDRTEEELVVRAGQAGVRVYGLSSCFIRRDPGKYTATVILGYANLSEEEISRGVKLLLGAWI